MFENKRKGWHGAYSISGKITAEHFDEILRKDKIFNLEKQKKLVIKDFFAPEAQKNNIDFLFDDIKSFQVYHKEKKHFSESLLKTILFNNNNKNETNKLKTLNNTYHNLPKPKNNLYQDVDYEPKYDLVFPKTLTGINWNKIPGRKKPKIKISNSNINKNKICEKYDKEENENNFLIYETKCLVDMNKYTKRGEFIELKDIRKRYDKPFKKKHKIFNTPNAKHIALNQDNKKNQKVKFKLKQSFSDKIIVPDFKKYLSRNYIEKHRKKKGFEKNNFLVSLSLNYDLIKERNITDIKFNHKKNKNSVNKFKGIDSTSLTDCYKNFDKCNNHLEIKVPNIGLMSPRYFNKKIYYEKANDYLRPAFSSFYKNSFNNFINLKLLNSIYFDKNGNNKIKNSINKIKNNMTFNEKSYKQLIKENDLNKLDGITLKTYKRKNKNYI